MNASVLAAIVTASGGIVVVALTDYLTKRNECRLRWQREKTRHCREFLSSMSALAIENDNEDAHRRFADAVNTVALVAPQPVIDALMRFHDALAISNPHREPERHDELLNLMLTEIRRDLKVVPKPEQESVNFHFIGAKPRTKT